MFEGITVDGNENESKAMKLWEYDGYSADKEIKENLEIFKLGKVATRRRCDKNSRVLSASLESQCSIAWTLFISYTVYPFL